MKKFKVWFDQINQQAIEVTADNEEKAVAKATRYWKESNKPRDIECMEINGESV